MFVTFLPFKKLRRNVKYLLFGIILLIGLLAVYNEMLAAKQWSCNKVEYGGKYGRRAVLHQKETWDDQSDLIEHAARWSSSYSPQTWKPEFKGQANLHVFEDWCGSSIADLRKNPHYPLYPHSRTTVQKLAVSPQWTNYGLRIFGYLHPYIDGDFVFASSSDDNSEFWLSTDESPINLQMLAWVGKSGTEWTAPGEFEKYASQISRPIRLSTRRKYYFEVLHKQNDKGLDHVEVAWKLHGRSFGFTIIDSKHISLYVDENTFLMNDVTHIPQTAASHKHTHTKQPNTPPDMFIEDPRDTIYKEELIDSKFLQGVLPDCLYNPSYIIKDYRLDRYQGLQFVHLSYIFPNDHTRLTHMETENSCFYPENPYKMKILGLSSYMTLDEQEKKDKEKVGRDFSFQRKNSLNGARDDSNIEAYKEKKKPKKTQRGNDILKDYGDDYDDYNQKRRRKLFSMDTQKTNHNLDKPVDEGLKKQDVHLRQNKDIVPRPHPAAPQKNESVQRTPIPLFKHLPQNETNSKKEVLVKKSKSRMKLKHKKQLKVNVSKKSEQISPKIQFDKNHTEPHPTVQLEHFTPKHNNSQIQSTRDYHPKKLDRNAHQSEKNMQVGQNYHEEKNLHLVNTKQSSSRKDGNWLKLNQDKLDFRKRLREKEIEMNMPLQNDLQGYEHRIKSNQKKMNKKLYDDIGGESPKKYYVHLRTENDRIGADEDEMENFPTDFAATPETAYDIEVIWNQTFRVNRMELQAFRSDWIDLNCNVSGNLLLQPTDALAIVNGFMDHLNTKHYKQFTLERIVNVVKRVDGVRGARYLLELEVKDANGRLLRLSQYIYALLRYSGQRNGDFGFREQKPHMVLCNPVGFRWNPFATVHFIVPVKNQARWVQQLIEDMEQLFEETGDTNFNLIITDFESSDMDVKAALQKSSIPRYEYVRLSGNFERSSGLQAGINRITDNHSIVFLCDLHIHFPPSIIDTIRKHCVEGHMAFAPIVLRLNCGATPPEARGYWEVNGFGLLGIYKSDLDAIGGMNTDEFSDSWGGEDWELLDRILEFGLEVERIYLRNFFHHYHSKRGMWNSRIIPSNR